MKTSASASDKLLSSLKSDLAFDYTFFITFAPISILTGFAHPVHNYEILYVIMMFSSKGYSEK